MPSYFTISKSYFTNYTIPFYKTSNNPKFYFFPILFKYSILFFLFLLFLFFYSFSSLSPSTSSTDFNTQNHTHTHKSMIHQSTYPNPSPHTYKHKLSNHQLSHTHKPFKPIGANNSHHTCQSKPATTTTWSRA